MAEEVVAGPAGRDRDRERGRGARAASSRSALNSAVFRVYVNDDLIGVELCAAAKNVIALAAGAVDGLGARRQREGGARSRAGSSRWRGSARRSAPTRRRSSGLAGMGDLIVTCWHPSGRNRRAGELIARGASPRARRAPRSARSSRASRPRRCCATSRTGSGSRCRSPRASAPCSPAGRCTSSPPTLMGRTPTDE